MPSYGTDPIQQPDPVKGDEGQKGQKGQIGIAGIPGADGPPGPKGLPGESGDITTIVYAFDTNTASNLPTDGLFPANWDKAGSPPTTLRALVGESVIDTRNNNIYVFLPGVPNNWTDLGALIRGAKGHAGDKGAKADKGQKGQKGKDGVDGVDGQRGIRGFTGVKGKDGDKGNVGAPGAQGLKGDLGPQGNPGINGTDGTNGTKGARGPSGYNGADGATGQKGTSGATGAKGEKGEPANPSTTARAVAYFDGTSANAGEQIVPISNFGFNRIEKIATGRYRCTFATPLPTNNFVMICQATDPDGELRDPFVHMRSTRSVTIDTREITGSHTPVDSKIVNVVIFFP